VRKTATKAARSAPSKSAGTPKITIKGAKASKHAKEDQVEIFDFDDDDMGNTFLQYWCVIVVTPQLNQPLTPYSSAMCEKQILVPSSSILYCSERYLAPKLLPPLAH